MASLTHLQQQIGYQFKDTQLLEQALTHRSCGKHNNERLEFLGDSLLNNIISRQLYQQLPTHNEGELSKIRASTVSNKSLAKVAEYLNLAHHISVGQSLQNGGYRSVSVMSDTVEAIIGAIFVDSGWQATEKFVLNAFQQQLESSINDDNQDAKSKLQEWLQHRGFRLPNYAVKDVTGPGHQRRYEVYCQLADYQSIDNFPQQGTVGEGDNRRMAEQHAADEALKIIELL